MQSYEVKCGNQSNATLESCIVASF